MIIFAYEIIILSIEIYYDCVYIWDYVFYYLATLINIKIDMFLYIYMYTTI